MPVNFREYEAGTVDSGLSLDPDTHAYHILSFLADRPETGFKPAEIAAETGIRLEVFAGR